MKPCRDLDVYLARGLDTKRDTVFEEHLAGCEDCRSAVASWNEVTRAVSEGARADAASRPVTAEDRLRLIAHAREDLGGSRSRRNWALVAVPIAAALLLALGAAVYWRIKPDESIGIDRAADRILTAASELPLSAQVGPARLALTPGSEIRVLRQDRTETLLELSRGRVALEVGPLVDGAKLTVEAGEISARVVGTVFTVSRERNRVEIATVEGEVIVEHSGGSSWSVGAGQRLVEASSGDVVVEDLPSEARSLVVELLSLKNEPDPAVVAVGVTGVAETAEAEPIEPNGREDAETDINGTASEHDGTEIGQLQSWRELVAGGNFVKAEGELTQHLTTNPSDTAAWSLLADCRRKSGRWSDAVTAYLELIDRAAGPEADLARYKAGVILQDRLGDHLAAARLFREYLDRSGGGPLVPDAMVRRARSLIAIGEQRTAKSLLERVVREHQDSSAAGTAQRQLANFREDGEGPVTVEQPMK
jgi:ferric-dicitrate binding protein FerR (iron transport regulator)